jgi:hypothetical protein
VKKVKKVKVKVKVKNEKEVGQREARELYLIPITSSCFK